MHKIGLTLLGVSLAVAGALPASPQDQPASASVPRYLQVTVEYTKPGKGGLAHDKTESAFAQAMAKAKFPINYTGYTAITGKSRAIYLSSFNSFEEVEKANAIMASPAYAAEFERLNVADGELLEETRTLIFDSVPELSFHSKRPGPQGRYLQAQIILVRPGHVKDFEELAKMVIAEDEKYGSIAHWGAYRLRFGEQAGTYVLFTAGNSLAELDQRFAEGPKLTASLSDSDKKKLDELRAAAIESSHSELYTVNPAQSYVPDEWIKADAAFWKPKTSTAPKPAAAEKKAGQ